MRVLISSDKSIYKFKVTHPHKYVGMNWYVNQNTPEIIEDILEDVKQEITEGLLDECLPYDKYEAKRYKEFAKVTSESLTWIEQ